MNIIINKEVFNVPKGWFEVSVEKFANMQEFSVNKYKKPDVMVSLEVSAALIGCSYEEISKITKEEYLKVLKSLEFVQIPPIKTKKDIFAIREVNYKRIKDLTQLTMGETVDMEMIINDSDDFNFLTNILPFLIKKEGQIFTKKQYESNKKLFSNNLMIPDVLFAVDFF